jgi:hypothetical protein
LTSIGGVWTKIKVYFQGRKFPGWEVGRGWEEKIREERSGEMGRSRPVKGGWKRRLVLGNGKLVKE